MEKIIIHGPSKLIGDIRISGSKNSSLPILILSILLNGEVLIKNVPDIVDVNIVIKLLLHIGSKIKYKNSICYIDNRFINNNCIPYELSNKIRASIWIIAPLLSRFRSIKTFLPGGCSIGSRPINLHINSLKKMGANIKIENKSILAKIDGYFYGTTIKLGKISVGATITIIGAAVLSKGITIIKNAAREPEIIEVSNFLNSIGANIIGAGTNIIKILGVSKLKSYGFYSLLPDRIETGTFLIAAAISRGNITCINVNVNSIKIILNKLKKTGASIKIGNDFINLNMNNKRPKSVSLYTSMYPGFPTDMQPQFSVLNSIAIGKSYIIENIFKNRFTHIKELLSIGANIILKKNKAIFNGVNNLYSGNILANDLRSSISLILAGTVTIGNILINNIKHIYRGYEKIFYKLKSVGLKFKIINN